MELNKLCTKTDEEEFEDKPEPNTGGPWQLYGGGWLINKQIPEHVANLAIPAFRKILHIKANSSQERNLQQHHHHQNLKQD